jgi:hypothetical protein
MVCHPTDSLNAAGLDAGIAAGYGRLVFGSQP